LVLLAAGAAAMNLRIIKKLSKRAAPLLTRLGHTEEPFRAEKWENYHGINPELIDRKHWERMRSLNGGVVFGWIKKRPAKGDHWIAIIPPAHALKGTIMVGRMSGYYEPEWEEQCAYIALCNLVADYFTEYDEEANELTITRDLSSPSLVFAAARVALVVSEARNG
jgi:hypothetical protein